MPRTSCHIPSEIMYLVVKSISTLGGGVVCLIRLRGTCKTMCQSVDQVVREISQNDKRGVAIFEYDNDMNKIVSCEERWFAVRCQVLQWIMSACVAFLHQDPMAVDRPRQKMLIYSTVAGSFGCNWCFAFKALHFNIHHHEIRWPGAKKQIVKDLTPRIQKLFPDLSTENIQTLIQSGMRLPGKSTTSM